MSYLQNCNDQVHNAFPAVLLLVMIISGCRGVQFSAPPTPAPALSSTVAAWGDSLTSGNEDHTGVSYPGVLSQLRGEQVLNEGVFGQTSTQIAARFLAEPQMFGDVIIIWSGRNNRSAPATVESDIASMVAAIPHPQRYLILSVENGSEEGVGTPLHDTIMQLNANLAASYPNNFLDIRRLIVIEGLSFEGITPTAQDLTDMSNDVPPSSLRFDHIHPNHFGYDFVAHKVNDWLRANYN